MNLNNNIMNEKLIQQTIDELNDYLVGDETKSNLQITLNKVLFDLAYGEY